MRTSEQIQAEIEQLFGFVPPFFEPALHNPQVLENLWQQTLSAYVNNPLSAVFKEKLCAYLSRFCAVPYCMICHSCALRPLGMKAPEVLKLLESPPPTENDIKSHLSVLAAQPGLLTVLPEPNSALEESLLVCSIFIFLDGVGAEHCRAELRRLLGAVNYQYLAAFVAYVKTCHVWIEANPEVSYEADKRVIDHLAALVEEPGLADFFRNYGERVRRERQSRAEQLAELAERQRNQEALRESEDRYRRLVELSPDTVFVQSEGKFVFVNSAGANLFGAANPEELTGKPVFDCIHPEDRERFKQLIQHLLEGNVVPLVEEKFIRLDGTVVDVEVAATPFSYGDKPAAQVVVRDITKRKRAEERSRFLAEASSILVASIDYKTTLTSITRLVVPTLADFCFFDVVTADKKLQRMAYQHVDPAKQEWFDQVQRYFPPQDFQDHPVANILLTGKALFVPEVNDTWMQAVATSAEHLQFMRDLQLRSLMIVPLIAHERKLGTLTFCLVAESGRNYTSADLTLAEDLAHRAALALDNARLYYEAQQALQEKELLLKEIHHRVKNNLQIVSGLLYLQFRYVKNEQTLQVLQETRTRIQSMALIHEKLYNSKKFGKIDFKDYIYSLLQNLFVSYCINTDVIALIIDIEAVNLDIDTAIPTGLIINELVSNALKYAFPSGQSGEIAVEFHATDSNNFELIVRDSGVGFTEELDFQKQNSLGLRLVHSLVTKQLEGTIELERGQGAKFKICLKA